MRIHTSVRDKAHGRNGKHVYLRVLSLIADSSVLVVCVLERQHVVLRRMSDKHIVRRCPAGHVVVLTQTVQPSAYLRAIQIDLTVFRQHIRSYQTCKRFDGLGQGMHRLRDIMTHRIHERNLLAVHVKRMVEPPLRNEFFRFISA